MRQFKDTKGRGWTVEVTVGAVKRVRDLLQIDLLALDQGNPPLVTRLGSEALLLIDVVCALLRPQLTAAGVSDEDWAEALGGEAALAAQEAFYAELEAFFRQWARKDLAAAMQAQAKLLALGVDRAEQIVRRIDLEGLADAAFATIPGEPSTNSPAPSESTPAP